MTSSHYRYSIRSIVLAMLLLFASHLASAQDFFVNAGLNVHTSDLFTGIPEEDNNSDTDVGYLLGLGVRTRYGYSKRHHFGFGVDFGKINSDSILGLRALDYQYDIREKIRLGAFFGAAKLKSGASQNGFYLGAGLTFYEVWNKVNLGVELRHGNGLARDRLPSEQRPDGPRLKPDVFIDFVSLAFFLGWNF